MDLTGCGFGWSSNAWGRVRKKGFDLDWDFTGELEAGERFELSVFRT